MNDLFTIDRSGNANQQADQPPPEYNTFIPLALPPSRHTQKTPITTRPFQSKPNHKQKKGKGKHKAGVSRKPNYGFPTSKKPAAIDWRGRPRDQDLQDDDDAELVRDYLANLDYEKEDDDIDDDEAGAVQRKLLKQVGKTRGFGSISRLANMDGLGIGGFSEDDESDDVDVADMLAELESDSDSGSEDAEAFNEDDAAVKPKRKTGRNRFEFPESGIHEVLTEQADDDLLEELGSDAELEFATSEDSDDSDASLNLANIRIEGDSDGMEDDEDGDESRTSPFIGGKSKWNKSLTSSAPSTAAKAAKFNQIHNGSFKKRSSERGSLALHGESDSDDDDSYGVSLTGQQLSKSARKKQAKRDRKNKRDKDRELREALKQEQARIAHTVAKKKAADAIDAEIARILHKVNKTVYEFMLPRNSDVPALTLPAMPGAIRRLVKDMAPHYALTVTLRGTHGDKQLVLHRNKKSHAPNDWQSVVEKVLSKKGNKILKGNTWSGKKNGKKQRRGPPGAPDDRTAPRPGDVVGEGAAPIAEDNLGHKMMLMMGWTPGNALGASSMPSTNVANDETVAIGSMGSVGLGNVFGGGGLGFAASSADADESSSGFKLTEPISVTVRAKRRGLGAE
ncbi:UNVERIFIED_CONTAM: hypothetical protein HDU68_005003 [Siphonaria sp. JEL0065]|nr:hypothetical protein HDU68_005003 [Siphonaria sp. JEL0065]